MSATTVYQNRLKVIRMRTAAAVADEWDHLDSLDADLREPFARKVAPIVAAGQLLAARTTTAYVSRAARIQPLRITPGRVTGAAVRGGLDPLDEYQRPFGVAWAALGDGLDPTVAKQRGLSRLTDLATMDVFLAMRATTAIIDQATPRITGWVRVADASACDLCSAADGTPMSQAADLAGHPGCGCTSEPQLSDSAPTEAADPEATAVHEHDELGPVLYQAGQHFAHA